MENDDQAQDRALRKKVRNDLIVKVQTENERMCDERNASRWKAERDPQEYEAQKVNKRRRYADAKDGEVRGYEPIPGKTVAEHEANAKARHAKKEKSRYQSLCAEERQAEIDVKADGQFRKRKAMKGMPEDQIEAELAVLVAKRRAKREAESAAKAAEIAATQREQDEWAVARAQPNAGIL